MEKFLGTFMGEDIFTSDEKIIALIEYMASEIKELRSRLSEQY